MKVHDILVEDPLREEKEIAKIEKILEQLKQEGHLTSLNEEAEMYKFGNRWIVDYGQEVGSREAGSLTRDMGQFNTRREAQQALDDFKRTGRRTVTGNVRTAVGRWREARSGRNYDRGRQLQFRMNGRFARALPWIGGIVRILMLNEAWETHKEYAVDLYIDHHMGYLTREQYDEALESHITAFAVQLIGSLVVAFATARTARRVLRAFRLASAAAGTLAGGPVGAAIGWLVGEGATYAALWFLSKRSTVEAIVGFIYTEPMLDMFGIDSMIANAARNTEVLGQDLARASGLDVRGIEQDRAARDNILSPGADIRQAPAAGDAAAAASAR